jgi:hypothetical protein
MDAEDSWLVVGACECDGDSSWGTGMAFLYPAPAQAFEPHFVAVHLPLLLSR